MKKSMKKLFAGLLTMSVIGSAGAAFAADAGKITVTVNGEAVKTAVAPCIENDRVFLPMRVIFETLGCNVSYREEDGKQLVTAARGEKYVLLEIGKKEISINGEAKEIDAAAKIEDDRTLVPVRAVSEALDADVVWDSETNTVSVTTVQGEHKISSVVGEKTVKDADGAALIYINYVYPVIENKDNNAYISSINDELSAYAKKFAEDAETGEKDAIELRDAMGKDAYRPMEYSLSYDVRTDRNGILSVTNYEYYNLGGAHPNSAKISRTFDLKNERELVLSDIIKGDDDEIREMVRKTFASYFDDEDYPAESLEELDKECDNVKFYLTDNSIVLYFDVYQVAPYAAGYPTVEIPYSEDTFKIDLSASDVK